MVDGTLRMKKRFLVLFLAVSIVAPPAYAAEPFDSDGDGLSDAMESNLYYTNSLVADTDGDGYDDGVEVRAGYNPNGEGKLFEADTDHDGLNDADELLFGSSLRNVDSDGDGYMDGLEVTMGFDPTNSAPVRLRKWIEIVIDNQELSYYMGPKQMGTFTVSTGAPGYETPIGTFHINNKIDRAWSRSARLWMPFWLPFIGGLYGIHELPEWPGGIKEGEEHLGTPASHGCVRLGIGAAETLYNWAEVGTEVVIRQSS